MVEYGTGTIKYGTVKLGTSTVRFGTGTVLYDEKFGWRTVIKTILYSTNNRLKIKKKIPKIIIIDFVFSKKKFEYNYHYY